MSSQALVAMGGGPLMVSDPAAIAAAEAAKARIQAAYIMAVQKPRNEDQARIDILAACKRPEFAARAEFAKPIGKDKVRGPSIRFAELALRTWGNIDSDVQVVYEDDNIRRVKVRVVDLQTNATFGKEIAVKKIIERRSKKDRDQDVVGERKNSYGDTVYILRATDDELMVKENALISKVIRNEGLRLIPGDIVDEGMETARQTLKDRDSKDPAAARKAVCDAFASIGVKPVELQKYIKHPIDSISPAELEDLRRIYQAIKDGDATWRDYIEASDQPPGDDEKAESEKASAALDASFRAAFAEELAGDKPGIESRFLRFLEETAATYRMTIEEAKAKFLEQAAEVKSGFAGWVARTYPDETKAPGSGTNGANVETKAQPTETPPGADADPNEPDSGKGQANGKEDAFRAEWINLKPAGFGKYVERNLERFKAAAPWIRDEAIAKFQKFYHGYACPIGKTSTETSSEMARQPSGEPSLEDLTQTEARKPQQAETATQQSPQEVQRQKVIDEIKRYHDAVVMESKRRMMISIMPSHWPPSLEGCMRLLDMVQVVAEEKGKRPS